MDIRLLEDETLVWDEYVNTAAGATNYHQAGWRAVIEDSFGHNTYYLMALSDGKMKGMLPLTHMHSRIFGNFLVSLPFFNYGGVVAEDPETSGQLINRAIEIARSLDSAYIELRHLGKKLAISSTKQHKVTMILDLQQNAESQWKAFNPKLRNQIRKAEKSGLSIKVGGAEYLKDFYQVMAVNMRDLGTPIYGPNFFENVVLKFPGKTRVFCVLHQGKTIAAGMASWFRDTLEIPWASSLKTSRALCPNNLLYWEAIKFGIENGFSRFDFGRSTPGEGTYRFKEQWGAKPIQLYWQYWTRNGRALPELSPSNPKYRLAIRAWRKLPVSFTKFLGPKIVKSIP